MRIWKVQAWLVLVVLMSFFKGISLVALELAIYTSSEVTWYAFCDLDLGKHVCNQALHFALLHFSQMLQSVFMQPRIPYL